MSEQEESKVLDLSGFGTASMITGNSNKFSSNKVEVLRNFDIDIKRVEENGLSLSNIKGTRVYELRCWMKKDTKNMIRIGARCRGKRVFLNREMCSDKMYKIVKNDKDSIIEGMKWLKNWYNDNMEDKDDLYYGDRKIQILESY